MIVDAAKTAGLLIVAALLQIAILSPIDALGGTADLVLITLVGVALLRGSIFGAATGFFAGLVVDVATLETLGMTSLLLTLAGYWVGRYGETTGRERAYAPLASIGVVTTLYTLGALALRFLLGEPVAASDVLLVSLLPALALNLILMLPVFALVRRVLRPSERIRAAQEVRLLG